MDLLINIITSIGKAYPSFESIHEVIGLIFSIMLFYKTIYFIIGVFFTRKFKSAKVKHKYAILIAARNEEKVIGNLLDSINNQDYDMSKVTVFVVADNCTDNTALVARKYGAVCYERFNNTDKTKGFALEFLCNNIEKDYQISSFEGYFVFDADNLLKKDYISKMNDAFDEGEKIITSYRNTKNFDESWVSSTYALHWLRSIRVNHRPRSILRLATNIQGTGFLFANELIKNGWHYTSLTEDRAFTADAVANGYEITYQNEAQFYDEQPTSLKIALRQRLRWSKGHLQAFIETGPKLFLNIFKIDKKNIKKSIRNSFASYDTLVQLTPSVVINLIRWIITSLIIYSFYSYNNGINDTIFSLVININPGYKALLLSLLINIILKLISNITSYAIKSLNAIYIFFIERKHIKKMKLINIITYIITFSVFDIIGKYTTYLALFVKVTWKPIPHVSKTTIKDLQK